MKIPIDLARLIPPRVALVSLVFSAGLLGFYLLQPLAWKEMPNVFKVIARSWLYLLICGAVIRAAIFSVVRGGGLISMAAVVILGLTWQYTKASRFIPIDPSRFMVIYGLAGITADLLRVARPALRQALHPDTGPQRAAP